MSSETLDAKLRQIASSDAALTFEAYKFVSEAVSHAIHKHRTPSGVRHVGASEIMEASAELAFSSYGLVGNEVLRGWGLKSPVDFGRVVFNLIEHRVLSRSEDDNPEDFELEFDMSGWIMRAWDIGVSDSEHELPKFDV